MSDEQRVPAIDALFKILQGGRFFSIYVVNFPVGRRFDPASLVCPSSSKRTIEKTAPVHALLLRTDIQFRSLPLKMATESHA